MEFMEIVQNFGFPVACVICLGYYIAKVESTSRSDSKERENRLLNQLEELSATNRVLLETNRVLAKEINAKLDQFVGHFHKQL